MCLIVCSHMKRLRREGMLYLVYTKQGFSQGCFVYAIPITRWWSNQRLFVELK